MEGHSVVSSEVVARYAADAALEVDGVSRIVEGIRKGIRVEGDTIEVHIAVRLGSPMAEVGAAVQANVAEYLGKMTQARPAAVNVVVDEADGAS